MQPTTLLDLDDDLSVFARGSPMLTPVQQSVADELVAGIHAADVNILRVAPGMGRTTILRFVQSQVSGSFVVARPLLSPVPKHSPSAMEEAFLLTATEWMNQHGTLLFDDFTNRFSDRQKKIMHAALTPLLDMAAAAARKLVFAVSEEAEPPALSQRGIVWEMEDFESEDYASIAHYYLGRAATHLDMTRVHRFAPGLTAYQIKNACLWLGFREEVPDTDSMIDYLRSSDTLSKTSTNNANLRVLSAW